MRQVVATAASERREDRCDVSRVVLAGCGGVALAILSRGRDA
jgi:hypothetical protein